MADDARRRDFTMNALYADRTGAVVDPLGQGLADLAARRIRFIEDAEARIREDYLRILRFFRFHAWYGHPADGMDPETLAPIAENVAGIDSLSRERVGHEMRRLLEARDPAPSLAAMAATGVLGRVLPGADSRFVAPLVHAEEELGIAPDAMRRLAALGGDAPAEVLKLSKAEARRRDELIEALASGAPMAELGYRHGVGTAMDAALLRAAFEGRMPDATAEGEARRGAAARFPVSAADLMPRLQGAALGRALKALEERWIASGFTQPRRPLVRRVTLPDGFSSAD
jgi:poly(A) polymerase